MFCYIIFGFLITKLFIGYLKQGPFFCIQKNNLYDYLNNNIPDPIPDPIRNFPESISTNWSIPHPHTKIEKRPSGYDERFPLWNSRECKVDEERIFQYHRKKNLLEKIKKGKYNEYDKDVMDTFDEICQNEIRGFRLFIRNEEGQDGNNWG